MNPWIIIGWCVVTFGCVLSLQLIYAWARIVALPALRHRRYHRQTRDVEPLPGQTWAQDGVRFHIKRIADNGRIVIETGRGASFSDSPDEWRERVRDRRLWLQRE